MEQTQYFMHKQRLPLDQTNVIYQTVGVVVIGCVPEVKGEKGWVEQRTQEMGLTHTERLLTEQKLKHLLNTSMLITIIHFQYHPYFSSCDASAHPSGELKVVFGRCCCEIPRWLNTNPGGAEIK